MRRSVMLSLFLIPLVLLFSAGHAAAPVTALDAKQEIAQVTAFDYLADDTGDITIDQILAGQHEFTSTAVGGTSLAANVHTYWVNFRLQNKSGERQEWLIGYEHWAAIDIYRLDTDGEIVEQMTTGYLHPLYDRHTDHYNPTINPVSLSIEAGQQVELIGRLQASTNMPAYPLTLAASVVTEVEANAQRSFMLKVVYFCSGLLLGTLIYNLFVYISTRDHRYFYYLGVVAFSTLFTFNNFSEVPYFDQFDATPHWISFITATGGLFYGFFIIMFTRTFLNVRVNFPWLDKILIGIMVAMLVLPVLALFKQSFIAQQLNSLFGLLTMIVVLITAIGSVLKRQPSAGYFLFAFSFFALGIIVFLCTLLGVLSKNAFTMYAMQYGTSLEAVLFSFALANRINLLRKENTLNQQKLIEQMTENEKLQKEWAESLEVKVEEQTRDLSRTNRELSEQNNALSSVNHLSRDLSAQLTRPKIVQLVGERMQTLYPDSRISMYLADNDENVMQPVLESDIGSQSIDELVSEVKQTCGVVKRTPGGSADNQTSALAVPIRRGEQVSGALVLQNPAPNGYTEASENLIGALGANIGTALSNASLFEETIELNRELQAENIRIGAELSVAAKLQQMILPTKSELDNIEQLQMAAAMQPTDEVGGDYYDVLRVGDRTTIAIGDVTGHGLASGVLMMQTQIALRTLLENTETDDVRLLERLNQSLYRNLQRMTEDRNLSLALVSHQQNQVSITGQHEELLLVKSNGETRLIDTIELGLPVGLEPDISRFLNTENFSLDTGDGLVLYTDGITEAEDADGKQYGIGRLRELVAEQWTGSVQQVVDTVVNDVRAHIGDRPIVDDITLVVLRQP